MKYNAVFQKDDLQNQHKEYKNIAATGFEPAPTIVETILSRTP